jgi:Ran GTPase-activating protein (RanGAP) involved in mRNA processing and transport
MNEINDENALEKLKNALLHSHLKELDLSFNHIGTGGARQVATALTQISTLEHLNLTHCHISSKGAHTLFQVLAKNTRLKELVADRNDFEGRRLRVLREFLSGNGGL